MNSLSFKTALPPLHLASSANPTGNRGRAHRARLRVPAGRPDDRLRQLVAEFESLKEPVERVRRLLEYAERLEPMEEWARCPCSRVTGCTTQVWVHVAIDDRGKVRFMADSDSEITKGFLSCLVWLLDGADPREVAGLRADDLRAMNVGLYAGRAKSRVNTWHNVLASMQDRTTKCLLDADNLPASCCYCHRR